MPNPYALLELPCDADTKQIKEAYRRLSKKLHPDKSGESSAAFQAVLEAYTTLLKKKKKPKPPPATIAASVVEVSPTHVSVSNVSPSPHVASRCIVRLALNELIQGCQKNITVEVSKKCTACPERTVRARRSVVVGDDRNLFSDDDEEEEDRGVGCEVCRGAGTVRRRVRKRITVPPGIEDGMHTEVNVCGTCVHLHFVCELPSGFSRRGHDLCMMITVSPFQMLTGYTGTVSLPDGRSTRIVVPGPIREGCEWMVAGFGVSAAGNLHLVFRVDWPTQGYCLRDFESMRPLWPHKPYCAANVVRVPLTTAP